MMLQHYTEERCKCKQFSSRFETEYQLNHRLLIYINLQLQVLVKLDVNRIENTTKRGRNMIPVDELKKENKEIDDLRKVLIELVEIPDMHGNSIFCELLERFQAKLNNHLKHEARSLYPELLKSKDNDINNLAKRFLDNTHELERLLGKYVKHWCHKLHDAELEKFIKETEEVFHLVEVRIKLEEKHLFPAM